MIQIKESQISDENIDLLNKKRLAFVSSEIRLMILAMDICHKRPDEKLYIAREKIYSNPRALGLSKTRLRPFVKSMISADISSIHSSGLFEFWVKNSMNHHLLECNKNLVDIENVTRYEDISLTIGDIKKFFLIVFILLFMAINVLVLELYFARNRDQNMNNDNLVNLLMVLQFGNLNSFSIFETSKLELSNYNSDRLNLPS